MASARIHWFALTLLATLGGAGLDHWLLPHHGWWQGVFFFAWVFVTGYLAASLNNRHEAEIAAMVLALKRLPKFAGLWTEWDEREMAAAPGPFALELRHLGERIVAERNALEAERAKLAAVLDSMQDWVVAVDANGAILWVNEPLHRALNGAARAGNALVEAIRDPEVLLCVRVSLDETTVCSRRAMGVIPGHIFDVNVAPLAGGGAVVVLRDATPVEQAERTQREFIANVSHELRTPLTSISGYVETLLDREEGTNPTERNFLEIILKNAQRMTRLTEDLLTLARVESGEEKFTPVPISAERLVTDAVASVRGVVKEAGATLTIGALAKDKVVAAPDAIVQVLSNLIENATRYGRPLSGAPAQVEVSATKATDAVRFEVRDRGVGIALEHQERIFERFYRVDKARSRETGGTGLGLAIAKHIVEQNRGRIWVESEMGVGSAFCFTLPLAG